MIPNKRSRTAEYVAFFRALESQRPASRRLFDDPLATAFLDRPLHLAVGVAAVPGMHQLVCTVIDRRVPGPRASAIARTRYIDDALLAAVARGIEQLVILGAGYDTRAHRLPELGDLPVIEVDHPDTQRAKRLILERHPEAGGSHVTYVGVDFDRQSLADAVERAGVQRDRATFVIWEGVASYLTAEAVDSVVRWSRAIAGPGSELVLTYVDRRLIDGTHPFPNAEPWVRSVARAGEPFVFGFDPDELRAYFAERGWALQDDLSTPEALARYGLPARRVPSFYRIARLLA
jgi:methyltransferase (TIGR00027 family)